LQTRGITALSQVEPCALQFVHFAPPDPQADPRKPPSQSPCASQHPGQLLGPHGGGGGWHDCPLQISPSLVQFEQALPPPPHSASLDPTTHTFPAVQHPAQFCGPHAGGVHTPLLHVSPRFWQFWQSCPPLPQIVSCPPNAQTPFKQHPAQFCGPHCVVGWQKPPPNPPSPAVLTHCSPGPQAWHANPPLPHAFDVVPCTQALPWQQPAQFCGVHSCGLWQLPPMH
jgi:hypothetical protein